MLAHTFDPEKSIVQALDNLSDLMEQLDRVRRVYRWLKSSELMTHPNACFWLAALEKRGQRLHAEVQAQINRLARGTY